MKLIILAALLVAASATPALLKEPIPIVRQAQDIQEDGTYNFSFETGDGISRQESGAQKQITPKEAGITSRGEFSYTAPDGTLITVRYIADENGFQPQGDHLPTPPPVPDHVVQLLATLRSAGAL